MNSAKFIADVQLTLQPQLNQLQKKCSAKLTTHEASFVDIQSKDDLVYADAETQTTDFQSDECESNSIIASKTPVPRNMLKLKRRRAISPIANRVPIKNPATKTMKSVTRGTVNSNKTLNVKSKAVSTQDSSSMNSALKSKVVNCEVSRQDGGTINSKLYETKTVYVSPFLPNTTVNDITDHLKSHQCYSVIGDLNVVKLVSDIKTQTNYHSSRSKLRCQTDILTF